mmetsp:Transcript_75576/g.245734  ORF Transcript_75576/g.245734 Transcript_75576/m.245734 type:complete len:202 (+) Transcript_75576:1065-1670(+)
MRGQAHILASDRLLRRQRVVQHLGPVRSQGCECAHERTLLCHLVAVHHFVVLHAARWRCAGAVQCLQLVHAFGPHRRARRLCTLPAGPLQIRGAAGRSAVGAAARHHARQRQRAPQPQPAGVFPRADHLLRCRAWFRHRRRRSPQALRHQLAARPAVAQRRRRARRPWASLSAPARGRAAALARNSSRPRVRLRHGARARP